MLVYLRIFMTKRNSHRSRVKEIDFEEGRSPPPLHILIALGAALVCGGIAYSRARSSIDDSMEAKIENCVTQGQQTRDGVLTRTKQELLYDVRQQIAADYDDDANAILVSYPKPIQIMLR